MQQKAVERKQPFIPLLVRVLFKIIQDADLLLNPQAEYSKKFYPEEIARLLAADGITKSVERHVNNKYTKSPLSQPKDYPAAIVEELIILFSQRKLVCRTFLTLIYNQAMYKQPNLLVRLEVDGDLAEMDAFIKEASNLVSEMVAHEEPMDFCLVSGKE